MALKESGSQGSHHSEEIVSRSEQFIEKYSKTIIWCVLGVIVLGVAIWLYIDKVVKPRGDKAAAQLYVAEEQFMAGADSAALNAPAAGAMGLLEIADKYSSTDAGKLAHAYAGIIYYDEGKYEEAIRELKEFKAKEKMVAPSITRLIGDCYVELGKYEEAAKYFMDAAKAADNPVISPSCLIKAGHVYEELGKYDQALKAYKEIQDKYYTAPESESIEASIIRVEAQLKK